MDSTVVARLVDTAISLAWVYVIGCALGAVLVVGLTWWLYRRVSMEFDR